MLKPFPIVLRELQVASRRPSTHGLRLLCALAACALFVFSLLSFSFTASTGPSGGNQGLGIFQSLSVVCCGFCLVGGVFTCSDALSRERREGTLKLLFLTDLHPMDVVMGKLTAQGVNLFHGLLGIVPLLALTFQLGGVTLGLFVKTIFMLFNTLFLSMAATLMVSSFSQDERRSLMASIGVAGLLYFGPAIGVEFLIGRGTPSNWLVHGLALFSPLHHFPFLMGQSAWLSLRLVGSWEGFLIQWVVVHGTAWSMLWVASRGIMDDGSVGRLAQVGARVKLGWHYFLYGSGAARSQRRRRLLDQHPMVWMVMREKLKEQYAWILVVSVGLIWSIGYVSNGEVMAEPPVLIVLGWFVHLLLKVWVAAEAATLVAADRRNGSMELLITTPLGSKGLVHGLFKASTLQFVKPIALLLVLELALMLSLAQGTRNLSLEQARILYVASMIGLIADMASIGWAAIWFALISGSAHKAISRAVLTILVIPWILYALALMIMRYLTFAGIPWLGAFQTGVWLWVVVCVAWNALFAWGLMRQRVHTRFELSVSEGVPARHS